MIVKCVGFSFLLHDDGNNGMCQKMSQDLFRSWFFEYSWIHDGMAAKREKKTSSRAWKINKFGKYSTRIAR